MKNTIDYHKIYEFIDLVRIYQRADFQNWSYSDKFIWSIDDYVSIDSINYYKEFLKVRDLALWISKK